MTRSALRHPKDARRGILRWLFRAILLFGLLAVQSAEASDRPTLDDLRTRWDRYMVEGRGAHVQYAPWSAKWEELTDQDTRNGLPDHTGPGRGLGDVFATRAGIVVILPARHPLLLWRRDGWTILGGRLGRIVIGDGKIVELYARSVQHEDGFYPPTRIHDGPPTVITMFEFFLLSRSDASTRGLVVRRWAVTPPDGPVDTGAEYRVSGGLAYEEQGRRVGVTLQVLDSRVVEEVPVDELQAGGVPARP